MENCSRILTSIFCLCLLIACSSTKTTTTSAPKAIIDKNDTPGLMEKYMNTINPSELSKHLYTIASDDFEGRNTGSRGLKMAADYISTFYKKSGLIGPVKDNANPYLQPILFQEQRVPNTTISKGEIELQHNRDFAVLGSNNELEKVDIVFAGYGVNLPDYNDFENIDLKGKAVMIISGNPTNSDQERLFSVGQDSFLNIEGLIAKGVTALFLTIPSQQVWDLQSQYLSYITESIGPAPAEEEKKAPIDRFLISPSKAAALFGLDADAYFSKIQDRLDNRQTLGGLFTADNVALDINLTKRNVTSNNVMGYLEGSDLKDEVIVISSHYDHDGIRDGQVYNGADDDGSGTVGVMEIAEAFTTATKNGHRPRRSILFLNVTGEEKGLLGSAHYADVDPIFPLAQTTTNLNIDMIGRIDPKHQSDTNYVYVIGSDMLSTELHEVHQKVSSTYFPNMQMDYEYNGKDHPDRFYYRSDHYNFAKNNIPVIFYFNGTHPDYHQPTDTPDKISYELLAERAKLVFATAWELANRDGRPMVDVVDESADQD